VGRAGGVADRRLLPRPLRGHHRHVPGEARRPARATRVSRPAYPTWTGCCAAGWGANATAAGCRRPARRGVPGPAHSLTGTHRPTAHRHRRPHSGSRLSWAGRLVRDSIVDSRHPMGLGCQAAACAVTGCGQAVGFLVGGVGFEAAVEDADEAGWRVGVGRRGGRGRGRGGCRSRRGHLVRRPGAEGLLVQGVVKRPEVSGQ